MLSFAALLLFSGCAVGPDYAPPEAPETGDYTQGALPLQTESSDSLFGESQRFVAESAVISNWWTLFGSADLDALIKRAIKANPSLEAARNALLSAQETTAASYGGFFPSVGGTLSASRANTATNTNPYTLYGAGASLSYIPDVFGSTRRTVEAAEARENYMRFEMEAAHLSLTTNLVTTALQEASLRAQIKATESIISAHNQQVDIMKAQLDAGSISKQEYLAQKAAAAAAQALLPPLKNDLARTRTSLSILLGEPPSAPLDPIFDLNSFKLPKELPLSLPSKLVEHRPDIRAAEAALHEASAQIGIAQAAMFPQFSLTGQYGISASRLADMFSPTTALWGLAAGLAQPLFQGGTLVHTKRAREATFKQKAAQYRATVLSAFKDVSDTLKTIETSALTLKAQAEAEKAAAESLELATKQFNVGATSFLALLSAQTAYQQARLGLIKAQTDRLVQSAALIQALGGGWWNRTTEDPNPETQSLTHVAKKEEPEI